MTTAVLSSAAISASPLHELDSTPGPSLVCGNVVVHANAAIAETLRDDDLITRSLATLRTTDFDDFGAPRRRAAVDAIDAAAHEIERRAAQAKSELERLRFYADHPAGDDRKAELDPFTGQLDAALERQLEIAQALGTFSGSTRFRGIGSSNAPPAFASIENDGIDAAHFSGVFAAPPSATPAAPSLATVNRNPGDANAARATANAIVARITEIEADEARAATHSEPAIGGC